MYHTCRQLHRICILNTFVYTGADMLDEACYKTLPQPACVVLQLIEPYITWKKSYILFKLTVASPKSPVAYHWSVMESLASRHISMSPSHPCVGHPHKQKYPDGDTLERLNGRFHIIDIHKQRSGTPSLLAQDDREPHSPSCSHTGRLHFLESCYKINSV